MSIDRIQNKRGSIWRARVLMPNGKRISKCFTRKVDAEHWEARLKSDGLNSQELKRRQTRFDQLCEMFIKTAGAELSPATYQKYESAIRLYLLPRFHGFWLEDINKFMVDEFKADLLKKDLSDASKRFIFSVLNTLLNKAVGWELLNRNPAQFVRAPRGSKPRTEYWNETEARQFLNAMLGSPRFPLYFIAINTGMRLGEILALKWDVVDFDNRILAVRRSFDQKTKQVKETTKTHMDRVIGLNDLLLGFFSRLRTTTRGEFVLQRDNMQCMDVSNTAKVFALDCKRARVRVIHFHDLRHTYATLFVGKGGSIHELSGVLGHTSTTMTARYAHFTPEHAQRAAKVVALDVSPGAEVISLEAVRNFPHTSGQKVVIKS
ncbi:MAG: tyrosine-type recombinase/integrase [Bdellovibrionota bacterium]|mgnify:CR=1 FL=1